MKIQRITILLSLLLVVVLLGCSPQERTRPALDLQEINNQVDHGPIRDQFAVTKDEGGAAPRVKDMSAPPSREHEYLKKGGGPDLSRQARGGSGDILLNFDNADIYEFIQVISETLGINYIVDPKVKGTVNIRSGQGIGKDQLFAVFRQILQINGLDIRNEGDYYYIHPAKGGAPQQVYGPTESGSLRESSRMVTQIIPVVHLSSAEAQKLIEPYLSEVGLLHNLTSQNTLVVSDFESKVLDMVSVLARLDISPLSALKVRMVKVQNAPLYSLRDELQEILTALAVNPKEHESVSIIPLERVNSLLLVSKSDQLLDATDRWIKELDAAPGEGQDVIHVYNVRNSVASDLATLVTNIIAGEDASMSGFGLGERSTTSRAKTGLELTAGLGQQGKGTSALGGSDASSILGRTTPTSSLSSSSSRSPLSSLASRSASSSSSANRLGASGAATDDADKPATAGKAESLRSAGKLSRQRGDRTDKGSAVAADLHFAGEPLLLPDDSRNIILIRALMPDYTRLVKLLERLDNMPRQVLIEVLVAEVTLNDSWQFGIEWALQNHQLKVNGSTYQQNYITTYPDVNLKNDKSSGLIYSVLNSSGSPVALLNALAGQTDVSLLSSPQVLVLNNEEATVNVGDQIPIVTSESVSLNTTGMQTSTVQYTDTGTILRVTPRINYDGMIILDIDQQVSSAVENKLGGTTSPIISTRELKTKLAVKNGQSIMMGGLIKRDTTVTQNKVPLLGDLPLVGWAFKYQSHSGDRTELLVMITPYVIESEDVLDQYIKKFKEKMQGLRKGLDFKPAAAAAVEVSRPVKAKELKEQQPEATPPPVPAADTAPAS